MNEIITQILFWLGWDVALTTITYGFVDIIAMQPELNMKTHQCLTLALLWPVTWLMVIGRLIAHLVCGDHRSKDERKDT